MTAHRDEPEPGSPIDRELTRRHEAFTAKIEAALDVEAGLRDILFQSRHEAFTAKVETALDMEAGLRDILTPPTIQAPPGLPPAAAPPVVNAAPGGSRWQASPAQRLKLRSNPRVTAASRVLHVVGKWASTSPLDLDLDPDLVRALDYVRALDLALDLTRDLARDLTLPPYRALDPNRVLDLDRNLSHVRSLGLARDLGLVRALSLARALDRDLARALDLARDRDVVRNPAPTLSLARALDLAHDLARALDHARALALDRIRCRCLEIINDEYTQAIGAPVAVDEESLASLMDDFTTDDLSDADVREDDIKLTGVRWSDGTTWPASTDIDRLKRRSDRQEDGSWIIRAGTGNVRKNVLT